MSKAALLSCTNVSKSFGGVKALQGVSLTIGRGEITALVGDNGAGKSTLVRCISGVHHPDHGTITFDGNQVRFSEPQQARSSGIETVHQNLALVDDLTIWQNLFLNREIMRWIGPLHLLDRSRMRAKAEDILSDLVINIPDVTSKVRRLSGGQRQAVAISRAASWGSKLIIMDEPTAALGVQETEKVEQLIRQLRAQGVTLLVISHNFDQVMRLSDQVWVMRAGRVIAGRRTRQTSGDELVSLITGAKAA